MSNNFSNDMNDELNRQKQLRIEREETHFDKTDRLFREQGYETFARTRDDGTVVLEVHKGDKVEEVLFNLDGTAKGS